MSIRHRQGRPSTERRIPELVKACEDSAIKAWADGRTGLTKGPWCVYISPTNLCNNRCRVCAREKAMRREQSIMNMDTFRRIVDQLPESVLKVYLMKQGEPLINRNQEDFVLYLREKRPDVHISFHTNGILAAEPRMRRILPHIDSLGVSISATDSESYKRVHNTDKFDTVIANLKSIGRARMEIEESKRPHVFVDYVYQEANRHVKDRAVVSFFRSNCPGISSVDIHWAFNFQGEIEEANMQIYDKIDTSLFPRCVFPWGAMTFCHDGRVGYCFVEPRENRFLGDIAEQELMEIWNGEEYQTFRRLMSESRLDELERDGFHCRKCTWLWSMSSQSPRNLSHGYSVDLDESEEPFRFRDLLSLKPEEMLSLGLENYLEGEMHSAGGCLLTAYSLLQDEQLKETAKQWLHNVRVVLGRYSNLGLWQDALDEESPSEGSMSIRYY